MNITVNNILWACHCLNYGFCNEEAGNIMDIIKNAITLGDSSFKQIISNHLNNVRFLAHDVASILAHEDIAVAEKILAEYPNFSERELTDLIVLIQEPRKLAAIAKRVDLNDAQIETLHRKNILSSADEIEELESRQQDQQLDLAGLRSNIDTLYLSNRLSSMVIINFLCKGDVFSFAYSLSRISELPQDLVVSQLYQGKGKDIRDILHAAGIPEYYQDALSMIIKYLSKHHLKQNFLNNLARQELYNYLKQQNMHDIHNMRYLMQLIKPVS